MLCNIDIAHTPIVITLNPYGTSTYRVNGAARINGGISITSTSRMNPITAFPISRNITCRFHGNTTAARLIRVITESGV
ncbi:hypothetical protein [Candidatus Vondammii sp. HM_W22]|uniref:hypothetical protein n=1 Tax=Candidatus Vondammii sp. HM_W22 TaxID=2687299 RepID=UPI001F13F729|nr:hypothetical protein [Candidatus Vondammii sp. HM_W22]